MIDEQQVPDATASDPPQKSWASRHPRAMILLIAAIFYVILIGMCATVFILLLRS